MHGLMLNQEGIISISAGAWYPTNIAGCRLWLGANDRGVTALRWDDKSGNNNHYTSAGASAFPSFSGGIATFDGSSDFLTGPSLAGMTAGEVFMRLKCDAETGSTTSGIAHFGTHADNNHYSYADGWAYLGFGSNVRKTCHVISGKTAWHTLGIWTAPNDWVVQKDGVNEEVVTTNTVAWNSSPTLGKSSGAYYFDGQLKSVLIYDHKLSTEDRATILAYMGSL